MTYGLPTDAQIEKEKALAAVRAKSGLWFERALEMVKLLPPGRATGEGIRLQVVVKMGEEPHHHNVWGALIRDAQRKGYITDLGISEPMKTPRSHARRTPIYYVN